MGRGFRWMIFVVLFLSSGCLADNRCENEPGRLVCPGGVIVEVEEEIPADAVCLTDGQKIVCDSGDSFEVSPEEESGDEEENGGPGGDDLDDRDEFSPWSSCEADSGQLRCENGETATSDEIDAEASGCRWHKKPGVGPRILCDGGSEFVPDGVSEEVSCEWRNDIVECNDGTTVEFDTVEPGECEPVFSPTAAGYVIRCAEERFEVENVEDEWCGFPSGEFRLTRDNIEEAAHCRFIFGNLVIEDTPFREIWELDFLLAVTGGLHIIENENLWLLGFESLYGVGGRVMVLANEAMEGVGFFALRFADEGIEITGNESLETINLPELRETSDLAVGSNSELYNFVLGSSVEVSGPFLFLDNRSFPICMGMDLLSLGTEFAEEGAYVGGLMGWADSRGFC